MITKFKIFEELEEWNKETGYYVILTEPGDREKDIEIRNFLENHIGRIKKMYYPGAWFTVEFDNVPEKIAKYFNGRDFHQSYIKYISKNKEDLEPFIQSNKYNL
jgi:hypothetical protein